MGDSVGDKIVHDCVGRLFYVRDLETLRAGCKFSDGSRGWCQAVSLTPPAQLTLITVPRIMNDWQAAQNHTTSNRPHALLGSQEDTKIRSDDNGHTIAFGRVADRARDGSWACNRWTSCASSSTSPLVLGEREKKAANAAISAAEQN